MKLNIKTEEIVKQYLESNINNFDEFIEALISSDIPQDVRPETRGSFPFRKIDGTGPEGKGPKTGRGLGTCDDEIEEELLISKDGEDTVLDDDIKDKENLLVSGCDKKK